MGRSAICCLLASTLAVLGLCSIDPARAQTRDLEFGKHRASAAFPCTPASAAFPCTPELNKRLATKLESGAKIFLRTLLCTEGDHTYALGVMEYPPEIGMGAYSVDALLESYRANVAGKAHVKIKSSQRMTHQGFPAVRYHVLDTRPPVRELVTVNVLVDRSMLILSVFAKSGSLQAAKQASFAQSLKIRAKN
jgi:hypothetical protein